MEREEKCRKMAEDVRASTGGKSRLKSSSFWRELGVEKRTKKIIAAVQRELTRLGLQIELDKGVFGSEEKDTRITLTWFDIPVPGDDWFESMALKVYEHESEVNTFFISPLFQMLGFKEGDFRFEFPVHHSKMEKKGKERIDLVLFDGSNRSPDNALVVVEAKMPNLSDMNENRKRLEEGIQDSAMYASSLPAIRRRVATNGDDVYVFDETRGERNNPAIKIHRSEFKERWQELYMVLGKQFVLGDRKSIL